MPRKRKKQLTIHKAQDPFSMDYQLGLFTKQVDMVDMLKRVKQIMDEIKQEEKDKQQDLFDKERGKA